MNNLSTSILFKQEINNVLQLPELVIEKILNYLCLAIDLEGYTNNELQYYIDDIDKFKLLCNKSIYNAKRKDLIKYIQHYNVPIMLYPFQRKLDKLEIDKLIGKKLHLINDIFMLIRKSDNNFHNILICPGHLETSDDMEIILPHRYLISRKEFYINDLVNLYLVSSENIVLTKIKINELIMKNNFDSLYYIYNQNVNKLKLSKEELNTLDINENNLINVKNQVVNLVLSVH